MAFEVAHRMDGPAGAVIRALNGLLLTGHFRAGHAALTVGGDAPATDHGVDALLLGDGRLMAHQHHHAAAFARNEASGALVVDPHLIGRERAHLGEAHQFKGINADVHPAGDGDVEIAAEQLVAGLGHSEQGGAAGAIHAVAAAMEIEVIADAAGDGVGETAGEGFGANGLEWRLKALFQLAQESIELSGGCTFLV